MAHYNSDNDSLQEDDSITLNQGASISTASSTTPLLHYNPTTKINVPSSTYFSTSFSNTQSCSHCGNCSSTLTDNHNHERHLVIPDYKFSSSCDPVEWLQMYEETALANNWTPRVMLNILPVYIEPKSAARTWFRESRELWENEDRDEDKFRVFKEAFLSKWGKDRESTSLCCVIVLLLPLIFFLLIKS
ncbi:MAG: hypothetical protein J3R72DRAFT_431012 [Linnemannia gamsii]|nr:MAG: hypothetical protein J3R72DRAFT_431012 [Linnemannia gamsii]